MIQAIIFFDLTHLPVDKRGDLAAREQFLAEAVAKIAAAQPDVTIGPPLASSFCLPVKCHDDKALSEWLKSTKLGCLERDTESMVQGAVV